MFWIGVGSGRRWVFRRPRSPVKTKRRRAAVFAIVELDDRRAQDVPGVEVGQGHARHDFHAAAGTAARLIRSTIHSTSTSSNSGSGASMCGYLRWALRTSSRWIRALSRSMTLAMSPVAGVVIDRPGISRPDQAGEPPDVVVMGVRDDHRVERAGVERELAVGAVGIDPIGVKQPAVEQNPPGADLQQMSAARDLPGRAVERDSQPSYLPTIDRAPAQRPRQAPCRGNAIAFARGQSSLCPSGLTQPRWTSRPSTARTTHSPSMLIIPS